MMIKTVKLEVKVSGCLNTDLIHWFMAMVEAWNNQIPESKMTPVSFETDRMSKPIFNLDDLSHFWITMRDELPYEWRFKR